MIDLTWRDISIALIGIIATYFGWEFKQVLSKLAKLSEDIAEFRECLPQKYVLKDDFIRHLENNNARTCRIEQKLDQVLQNKMRR